MTVSNLAKYRILVVEDETLIAVMIEDALLEMHCEVVGPTGRLDKALARISQTSTGIACRYSTFESEINVLQLFDLQSKEDSLF